MLVELVVRIHDYRILVVKAREAEVAHCLFSGVQQGNMDAHCL